MSNKFKASDKVYCPQFGTGVYNVYPDAYCNSPLVVRTPTGSFLGIDENGKHNKHDELPSVFHATPENKNMLESLYNVEFEKPKRILKGSALCKLILKTKSHVLCFVSDGYDENAIANKAVEVITSFNTEYKCFMNLTNTSTWNFAVPIDPETLKPLEIEVSEDLEYLSDLGI